MELAQKTTNRTIIWPSRGGTSGKESACQCMRCKRDGFHPWVERMPWRRAWQLTPIFLPGESLWTEEPGRLQSIGLQRVRHYWTNLECMHTWPNKYHSWVFIQRRSKTLIRKDIYACQFSEQHYLQLPRYGSNQTAHQKING